MTIGNLFRGLRADKRWKLDEAARRSGISRSALSRIELGQQGIAVDQVEILCEAFGISMARLFALLEAGQSTGGDLSVVNFRALSFPDPEYPRLPPGDTPDRGEPDPDRGEL